MDDSIPERISYSTGGEMRRDKVSRVAMSGGNVVGLGELTEMIVRRSGGGVGSPLMSRWRLGAELRVLRERRGLSGERLGALLGQSRMKITRLENGQVRPDLPEVMEILGLLDASEEERARIAGIAYRAGGRGWWASFDDVLGDRDRLCADLEHGAEVICEYAPGVMPVLLQTPEYAGALLSGQHGGLARWDRFGEALRRRQRVVLREGGPAYEVILDEVGLRRFPVPSAVMGEQLRHVVGLCGRAPGLRVRVLPVVVGPMPRPLPTCPTVLYGFPDPDDPRMAVMESATGADLIGGQDVTEHDRKCDAARDVALSETESLALLSDLAGEL